MLGLLCVREFLQGLANYVKGLAQLRFANYERRSEPDNVTVCRFGLRRVSTLLLFMQFALYVAAVHAGQAVRATGGHASTQQLEHRWTLGNDLPEDPWTSGECKDPSCSLLAVSLPRWEIRENTGAHLGTLEAPKLG